MESAGVYISVPFCRQKCTYCNFASGVHPSASLHRYGASLVMEILTRSELWKQTRIPEWPFYPVDTIYMGGGTPALLAAEQMSAVFDGVRQSFRVEADAEITIEASPENITAESAFAWRSMGINRVSMGAQSMVTGELRSVGRMHSADTVRDAFRFLRAAGIEDVSMDLIAGLPKQTAASWRHSIQEVLALAPTHISVYMLEVDDDSRLGSELLHGGARYSAAAVPDEDAIASFYETAIETLQPAGYAQYEISNFARAGHESRHNLKYWENTPYFGFGAGAHSYDGDLRWENMESIEDYLNAVENSAAPVSERMRLDSGQKLEERFFLGLRRRAGISLSRLENEFQNAIRSPLESGSGRYSESIREFCAAGLLESDGDCLRLTRRGLLLSNEVFAGFLGENR